MTRTVTTLPVTEKTVGEGNYDTNRAPVELIILHSIVGNIEAADGEFNRPNSQKSVHYGVGYSGEIVHWVDEDKVAYGAGNYEINQKAINIEHQDNGMVNGEYDDGVRPNELYTSSAKLVADICTFYNIPIDREHIRKHCEVSKTPTACPSGLDIERIVKEVRELVEPSFNPEPTNIQKVKVTADKGLFGRTNNTTQEQNIVATFEKGTILDVTGTSKGESIKGNDRWFMVKNGEARVYVWSGGVEALKEEVKPEPKPVVAVEDKDKTIRQLQRDIDGLKKENKRLLDIFKKLNDITGGVVQVEEAPVEKKAEVESNVKTVTQSAFENLLILLHLR